MIVRMRKYFCLVLFMLMASQASGYIGVIPSQSNLGVVERGETYNLELYATSDETEPMILEPTAGRASLNTVRNLNDVDYFNMEEYSAEPVGSWFEFSSDTYTLRPEGYEYRKAGREVNANMSFELRIPRGAEPGYHAANIELNPRIENGEGTSVRTIAVSSHKVFFRVPGEVNREIEIRDLEALRSDENAAIIRAEAVNTGSVTTRLFNDELSIVGDSKQGSVNIGGTTIAPGDSETIETTWNYLNDRIEAGNYRISGSLSYATGRAFIQESVQIEDFIQITPSDQGDSTGGVIPSGQGENSLPIWLILMFLVIVGSIMYAFEIDPLLIIMAIGVIGISAVIFFSTLPTYSIAIVLMAAGGIFYYGWL